MISEISVFLVEGSMIWQLSSSSLAEIAVDATLDAAAAGGTSAGAAGGSGMGGSAGMAGMAGGAAMAGMAGGAGMAGAADRGMKAADARAKMLDAFGLMFIVCEIEID